MYRGDLLRVIEQRWFKNKSLHLGGLEEIVHQFGRLPDGPAFGFSYGLLYRPAPYLIVAIWNEDVHKGMYYEQDGFVLHIPLLHFMARTIHTYLSDLNYDAKLDLLAHLADQLHEVFFAYDEVDSEPGQITEPSPHDLLQKERLLEEILQEIIRTPL